MIKTTEETITALELPTDGPATHMPTSPESTASLSLDTPFKDYLSTILRDAEEKYLVRMLRLYKGNINQIAKLMDIDRKTVYRKMSEYSIDPSSYRG